MIPYPALSRPSSLLYFIGYRALAVILPSALALLKRVGFVLDYAIDEDGLSNDLLIDAFSPLYDEPSSGLPRFARWKTGSDHFIKIDAMTFIITPGRTGSKGIENL